MVKNIFKEQNFKLTLEVDQEVEDEKTKILKQVDKKFEAFQTQLNEIDEKREKQFE